MATVTIDGMRDLIGTEATSDWIMVTQEMIDRFADATGDHQFIHVDPVRAAATPFGGTIAHGFLTLSLIPQLGATVPDRSVIAGTRMSINYGGNRLRFLHPVRSGSRIRATFKLLILDEKTPGQIQQVDEITIAIDGAPRPALVAEWVTLHFV